MRLAVAVLVLGYVMPPYSVLRRMAESRDDLQLTALKVDGTATVPVAAAPEYADALGVTAGQGELQLSVAVSMRLAGRRFTGGRISAEPSADHSRFPVSITPKEIGPSSSFPKSSGSKRPQRTTTRPCRP